MVITSRGKPVAILTATDSQRVGDTILEIQRQEAISADQAHPVKTPDGEGFPG